MARKAGSTSRFFISIKHSPLVSIQISEDLFDKNKSWITETFGVKAIEGMSKGSNGIIYFDFEVDQNELEILSTLLKHIYDSHIVKEIDIDLNLN